MAIDVSVYSLRISDGYLSTVAGGTVLDSGASPFAAASSSGGGSTGVVRVTGDQRIAGIKIFDASIDFTYDLSIGGDIKQVVNITASNDVSIAGNLWVEGDINGGLFGNDVVISNNLTVGNDVSISGNLYVDGSTFQQDITIYDTSVYDWTVLNDASVVGDLYVQNINILDAISAASSTTYVDGSLSLRDASISSLFVENDSQDTSIAWLNSYRIIQDISIAALESSIGTSMDYNYVDGSLSARDTSIAWLRQYQIIQDASIAAGSSIDVSLGGLSDVNLSGAQSDYSVIRYDSASNEWWDESPVDVTDILQKKAIWGSPASNGSGGQGDLQFDASYLYVCTSTNKWIRIIGQGGY
jgi:hypothetical protein